MANSQNSIDKIEISYDPENMEEWDEKSPNRRVTIRNYSWMVRGAANRVLKNKLFEMDTKGKVKLNEGIFRERNAAQNTRLNLKTTTKADDKAFVYAVQKEVQRVVDEGPQNPEYAQEKDNERRQTYNMDVEGAVIRAMKLLPPHIKDPGMLNLPDDFFRENDTNMFKARVLSRLHDAMMEAKNDHPTRLEIAAFTINEQIQNHPAIDKLRKELGDDVFDLTELFQWTVQMCKGEVPTRVTEEYMFYIFEKALELADNIYMDITDPQRAEEIESGFKEALLEAPVDEDAIDDFSVRLIDMHNRREQIMTKILEGNVDEKEVAKLKKELKEIRNYLFSKGIYKLKGIGTEKENTDLAVLEGEEFVKELYKKMGIHIGFQGLQSNKELAPVAKEYDDLARVFRYLMGWDKRKGTPDPERTRSLWDSKREMRTKDYIQPSLILAFDEEFFKGMNRDEQISRLEILQSLTGKEYLDSLGVIKVMELAARTAILDGKDIHESRERAKNLCDKNIRIVLGNNPKNADYYIIRYDTSEGFESRKINYRLDDGRSSQQNKGLALGRVVLLKTRSEDPLGMK